MNSIPASDRIDSTSEKPTDDYGNIITMEQVKENIFKILDQYGIIKPANLKPIIESITSTKEWKQAEDKLLEWLAIKIPAIAEILTNYEQETVKVSTGWFSSKEVTVKKRRPNWEGLALHGALMKG